MIGQSGLEEALKQAVFRIISEMNGKRADAVRGRGGLQPDLL